MQEQTAETGGAVLSDDELDVLRAQLEEQRRFRLEQLRDFGPLAPRAVRDRCRGSAGQREVQVQLAACARMVLADVEAALRRMAAGRYGWCRRCARPVPFAWLEIVPQARYCPDCHRERGAGR